MGHWLGVVASFIIEGRSARFRKKIRQREMTLQDLECIDFDGDGHVSRAEFLEFMLLAMDKVDKDIKDISKNLQIKNIIKLLIHCANNPLIFFV